MSNKNWKIFTYIGVGAVIVGGAATGLVLALTHKDEEFVTGNVGPLKVNKFEYKDNHGNVVHSIPGLNIRQYKTKKPDGSYDYYLNDEEVNLLVKKFFDNNIFGPEVFKLKSITLSNQDILDGDTLGLYTPSTRELNIYPEDFWAALDKKNEEANSDLKIEMVSEVLYHEYGHHIAFSYMNNPYPAVGNLDHSTYIGRHTNKGVIRVPSKWNKHFMDNFKREFTYDRHTDKLPIIPNTTKYQSIGSYYDAKDLFDGANGQDNSMSFINNIDQIKFASIFDEKHNYHRYLNTLAVDVTKESLSYIYSVSEQFTRKFFASTYKTSAAFSEIIDKKITVTPLQEEELYHQTAYQTMQSPKPNPTNPMLAMRFLQDAPFPARGTQRIPNVVDHTNTARNFSELVREQLGQKDGADISFIFNKNNWNLQKGNQIIYSTSEVSKNDYLREGEMIKFGGYISNTEKSKYTHVGYFTSVNGKQVFHPYEILKNHFNFGYKHDLYSSSWTSPLNSEDNFYVTKDWINGNDISGHALYFATDAQGHGAEKFKTIRSSTNTGYASSLDWEYPHPSWMGSDYSKVFTAGYNSVTHDVKIVADKNVTQGGTR